MIPPIRVAAKAVVIDGGEILLTRNLNPNDPDGEFFLLPGGGQHYGESLSECVRREVLEETGYGVSVGDVLFVRDYIGANHEFAAYEPDVHQVEVMFSCSVDRSNPPAEPTESDDWQLSVEWVRIEDLADLRLFPRALAEFLIAIGRTSPPGASYLGDVN